MSELYNRTRELLRQRPRSVTYAEIAKATGLPFDFVKRCAYDLNRAPNVHNVEKLYVYLSGRRLEL